MKATCINQGARTLVHVVSGAAGSLEGISRAMLASGGEVCHGRLRADECARGRTGRVVLVGRSASPAPLRVVVDTILLREVLHNGMRANLIIH